MKTLGVLFFIVIAGIGNAAAQQSNAPQKPKVRPDVSKRVQEKGVAKVGVMLSGQWELDSKLTKEAALAQRQAIAAAQKSLMAELAGTRYKVISNSKIGPYMSLEVGPDAVAVLEGSNLVKDVYLDEMVYRPGLMDSVPLIRADQAWAANYDRTGQGMMVVDTGVDGQHTFRADLGYKFLQSRNSSQSRMLKKSSKVTGILQSRASR